MRRGLVHALAWSLATGAAVTLSWWGVHSVLSGTVYDPPRALPLPAGTTALPVTSGSDPLTSSTRRPEPPATSRPSPKSTPPEERTTAPSSTAAATPSDRPDPTTAAPATTTAAPATASAAPVSSVKSYPVDGGRVTFDLGDTSAELVSATPASGWQMQVWKQPTWIRVTFTKDGRELSVFCLWHDSAPRVEIEDRQS
ncbi:hypothetical protein ABZY68_07315 [Streptomyces sp. NPDC006482]|uniref:hypothetical protein n=1 Tax=unclassified Streptomyces TaxID=2593676 RepID=UPI0022581F19|nr:hypothetical protein [Streptomyces sp. NBC_00094]MCX5390871.1 hypothetical protein [Streptomyces sp. NBC_00094]